MRISLKTRLERFSACALFVIAGVAASMGAARGHVALIETLMIGIGVYFILMMMVAVIIVTARYILKRGDYSWPTRNSYTRRTSLRMRPHDD